LLFVATQWTDTAGVLLLAAALALAAAFATAPRAVSHRRR
jgi:hypothetical protein